MLEEKNDEKLNKAKRRKRMMNKYKENTNEKEENENTKE